jgi:hypothetical protein
MKKGSKRRFDREATPAEKAEIKKLQEEEAAEAKVAAPEIHVDPVSEHPVAYSTSDLRVTTILNKNNIHAVACSGNPMVYTYPADKTAEIVRLLKEAGL